MHDALIIAMERIRINQIQPKMQRINLEEPLQSMRELRKRKQSPFSHLIKLYFFFAGIDKFRYFYIRKYLGILLHISEISGYLWKRLISKGWLEKVYLYALIKIT